MPSLIVDSSIKASVKNEIVIPKAFMARSNSSYFKVNRGSGHSPKLCPKYVSSKVKVLIKLKHLHGESAVIIGAEG